ncbi:hypothetical protein GCK32_009702 [Trichostrongylus colubriformis]|uniref:Uncharacterized protein n=1 Tax=Trichostrongylus colubriformis TaxID=6319 RepID=A0AAN8ER87_TRICO
MDENSTKQVYRSLFVISTIVLCGWISGIVVSSIVYFLELELTLRVDLVSGICVNLATASNFFVYYAISLVAPSEERATIYRSKNQHWKVHQYVAEDFMLTSPHLRGTRSKASD